MTPYAETQAQGSIVRSRPWESGRRVIKWAIHGIFWSWNGLFLLTLIFGLGPHVILPLLRDAADGRVPWDMLVGLFGAAVIPCLSTLWGGFLARQPAKLALLFYGLELPLLLFCLARLFLVRELTPPQIALLGFAVAGTFAFALNIKRTPQRVWAKMLMRIGLAAAALTSLYLALILAIYTPPFVATFLKMVSKFGIDELWRIAFPALLMFGLFVYTATLTFALPLLAPWMHLVAWFGHTDENAQNVKPQTLCWSGAASLAVAVTLSVVASHQPQQSIPVSLTSKVGLSDPDTQRLLLKDQDKIREGLVNAYLSSYRYFYTRGNSETVSYLYEHGLGIKSDLFQTFHDFLVSPWLYDGTLIQDPAHAEKLYEAFFDEPIQRGERKRIQAALEATWDRDGIEAGLLDKDRERVLLVSQDVSVTQDDTRRIVEIHETYENKTPDDQEILYHFTLPQSAVVTGLWLGLSPQKDQADRFVVAPRGAAQKVYRAEVRRGVDPALLEKLGPFQYRLRIFPIPENQTMHMWLSYQVLAGVHPTRPQLLEKRNVYYNETTKRTVNGAPEEPLEHDFWVPPAMELGRDTPKRTFASSLVEGLTVRATPASCDQPLPVGRSFLIAVDRSYSMAQVDTALRQALRWAATDLQAHNRIDLLLTSSELKQDAPKRIAGVPHQITEELVYFGGQALSSVVKQAIKAAAHTNYDAVFVLTDGSGSMLEPHHKDPIQSPIPLSIVHLGTSVPTSYGDALTAAVHESGGVMTRMESTACEAAPSTGGGATMRRAIHRQWALREGSRLVDGYRWTVSPGHARPTESPFEKIAALAAISDQARQTHAQKDVKLDRLHRLALRYEVVSPFSSMIVLVNPRQHLALKKASASKDRFQRSFESGKEAVSQPSGGVLVPAVPEPEEWALIFLAAALLATAYVFKNRATLPLGPRQ